MTKLIVLFGAISAVVQAGLIPTLDLSEYLKADIVIPLPAQAALSLALGIEAEITLPMPTLPELEGLHTAFFVPETGQLINVFKDGYTDFPTLARIGTDFTQTATFDPWTGDTPDTGNSTSNSTMMLERRDICQRISTCVGKAADKAETFKAFAKDGYQTCTALANSVNTYLSANDYKETKAIIANAVTGFAINIISTPFAVWINNRMGIHNAGNGNDACGQTQPATYAGEASSAIYQFCVAIKNGQTQDKVPTAYIAADSGSFSAKAAAGLEAHARFFIAQQKDAFAEKCKMYDIELRKAKRWLGF